MDKIRAIWIIILIAALVVAVGLWSAPFTGWASLLAKAGSIAIACVALGVVANLSFTIFSTKEEDLWDSSYFKYMRVLWGNTWGGPECDEQGYKRLLQIDTCRANYLAMWTSLAWLLLLSLMGFILYLDIYALFAGALPNLFDISSSGKGDVASLILLTSVSLVASGVCMALLFYPMGRAYPAFQKKSVKIWLSISAICVIIALVVFPVVYHGLIPYLKVWAAIATFLLIGLTVYVIIYGLTWLGKKISQQLTKGTAPGRLMAQHKAGIKQKVCIIITQKPKKVR